jgi:hypothetical protein
MVMEEKGDAAVVFILDMRGTTGADVGPSAGMII